MLIEVLTVVCGTWLAFGVLHYSLCMKDWRREAKHGHILPHAWVYAILVFVPMVLFGPIGLVIRDWTRQQFPHWYRD